mmetsp:Transcript_34055/g.111334  ORF Transcript_34055/g.111334 Transcript_34055/m.111334 type:complete len:180 (+) Transcript_34055:121-660(+)
MFIMPTRMPAETPTLCSVSTQFAVKCRCRALPKVTMTVLSTACRRTSASTLHSSGASQPALEVEAAAMAISMSAVSRWRRAGGGGGGGSDSGDGGRGDGGSGGGGGLVGRIDLPTLLEALSARGLDPAVRTRGGDEAPVLVELDGGTLELRGAQSVVRSADFDLIVLVQEAIREQLVEL